MLGLHSIPVIADAYLKNIRGYDAEKVYTAMKTSLLKDTIGYSMRYFVGLKIYKKFGYVPADLEMEATARTLEYAYDDWCMAQMAKAMGKTADYDYFLHRSRNYKNVFDKEMGFMNGRLSNGTFRRPFNPFQSSHRNDDFCEGNAWQWSFFVPHDIQGLATLLGGEKQLANKLDTLFNTTSKLDGNNASGDISGLIGQYAHGNEPSHHIAYMYNSIGQAWKTQRYVNEILTTLYSNTPDGICGDEDTGQMSAWYVFSAMGFYPMNPANQQYEIGSPLFDKVSFKTSTGKMFRITTKNRSKTNIYIQSARLNGKALKKSAISYFDVINGGNLEFVMSNKPNKAWGK
jgi:predicted alpha-1,2-mannosidase